MPPPATTTPPPRLDMAGFDGDNDRDEELEAFQAEFEGGFCDGDSEDKSVEDVQNHDKDSNIEQAIEQPQRSTKHIILAESTPSVAAAQVFAIPELLEMILLSLNIHTKGPFKTSHTANAVKLCRPESVNRDFRDTLRSSPKLKLPKQDLRLDENPSTHAAVIWLLRELGHSGFSEDRDPGDVLVVKYSPSYCTAVTLKQELRTAMTEDQAWRKLKIAKRMTIRFDDRSVTYRRVESDVSTLGELWKTNGSRL